jgi:hypothetical protein
VFENRILKRILGPKMDDVTGEWRKLHNEELHNLYLSSNIIRQIKLRRVRQGMWHAWEKEKCTRLWWESPKEGDHSEDQGIGGKMASEWILGRLAGETGFDWLRTGTGGGL